MPQSLSRTWVQSLLEQIAHTIARSPEQPERCTAKHSQPKSGQPRVTPQARNARLNTVTGARSTATKRLRERITALARYDGASPEQVMRGLLRSSGDE